MLRDHYSVLNLSANRQERSLKLEQVRSAYRQALLAHHPDKSQQDSDKTTAASTVPTIDEIRLAYRILSDPPARAEYDRDLRLSREKLARGGPSAERTPGLEIIDLDDMAYNEKDSTWTRECRCGTGGGYLITEEDLEQATAMAESRGELALMVGCTGCSLSLKVMFAVDDG